MGEKEGGIRSAIPPYGAKYLIEAISKANLDLLVQEGGFTTTALTSGVTNLEALQEMRATSAVSMVVVDHNRTPVGVVRRDHIVAQLVEKLASGA